MPDRDFIHQWRTRGRVALVFLTRLPVGRLPRPAPPLAEAAALFPLAGIVVGVLAALVYGFAAWLGLPPLLAALAAVAASVLMTGALHEDALADVADGFGGGATRERKLEIMRDSALGSYGGLALILSLGARVAALAALAEPGLVLGALVASHAVARAVLPPVMAVGRPARADGLGAGAGLPSGRQACVALAFGLLAAAFAAGPLVGLLCLAVALAGAFVLLAVARRQVGGYTGDVLGAAEQLAEILVLLTLVCLI